jgi:hypothetical protein
MNFYRTVNDFIDKAKVNLGGNLLPNNELAHNLTTELSIFLNTLYNENFTDFLKVKISDRTYNKHLIVEINPLLTEYLENKYPEHFI